MSGELKRFPDSFMQCVEVIGNGAMLRVASDTFWTQKFAYHSASANGSGAKIEYIGFANPGAGISGSGWAIKQIGYDASGNITNIAWAGSSLAMNKMWDDRATYVYG